MTTLLMLNLAALIILSIKIERSIHYQFEFDNDDKEYNDWEFLN
jgi:hypothetical protein